MADTALSAMPAGAEEGEEFNLETSRATASAAVLGNDEGRIWSARLTNFADARNGREWVTDLFVQHQTGSLVRFGAQLACVTKGERIPFEHSRPRVVREMLEHLAGEADGQPVSNQFVAVTNDDSDNLVDLIFNAHRRLPIVLVSTNYDGNALVDMAQIATRLSGTAHLRSIGVQPSFILTDRVGKQLSTFNGAVRVYMPGLDIKTADPFQHPLWLARRSVTARELVNDLARRVLPMGYRDADGDTRFWQISLLRQAQLRKIADHLAGSKEEQLSAEIDALRADLVVAKDTTQAAEALMTEEALKLSQAQADLERLQEQEYNLHERLRVAGITKSGQIIPVSADDIYSVFEQNPLLEASLRLIGSTFSDRITVLDSAFDSARISYAFKHRKRAFLLLWSLSTDYWSSLNDGQGDVVARQCFGASYAAREAATISNAGMARRTFLYQGNQIEMEKHLKIGVKDSLTETLRVHFEWIGAERRIVIGHCGGHIDF